MVLWVVLLVFFVVFCFGLNYINKSFVSPIGNDDMSQDRKPVNQMTEEELDNELREVKNKASLTIKKIAVTTTRNGFKNSIKYWGFYILLGLFIGFVSALILSVVFKL